MRRARMLAIVDATGFEVTTRQPAAIGDLSSGFVASGAGTYVMKLSPGAERAVITLHADYGFGDTAVYRYEKRR